MENNLPALLRDMAQSEITGSHRERALLDAADEIERQQQHISVICDLVSALRGVVLAFGEMLLSRR
ncbi:MAG TPA: hypothetical protein VJ001_02210 [Rhodocyclaceae bacterium]|nr:hypothetical protein [Rhodocyclaceae bacterium]